MPNAIRIRKNSVVRQEGELARLKVVNGPDYGSIFIIVGNSVSIGRGEECDAVISDLKASRKHATITYTTSGWHVRDLGSANGILLNGRPKRDSILNNNDTVTIGETVLEFLSSTEVGTQILTAPPKTLMQIQAEQAALQAHQIKIRSGGSILTGIPGMGSGGAEAKRLTQNPLFVAGIVAIGLAAMLYSDNSDKKVDKKKSKAKEAYFRDLSSVMPPDPEATKSINKAADTFYRAGFREYRERNYLRARIQFETVLQILPGHNLARMYLDNSNKAIEDEVKLNLESGKRTLEAGKFKEAKSHYEQVIRLLYRAQTDPAYIEATEQLKNVEKEKKGGVN